MDEDFLSMIARQATAERHKRPDEPRLAPDIEAVRLRDALSAFQIEHTFRIGDIVRQKPQATLYAGFGDNDLAIVVDLLPTPIFTDKKDHGSPYFNLPLGRYCLSRTQNCREALQ